MKLLCYYTSSLMLTQKPFTAWRVVGLSHRDGGGKRKRLNLPSMSPFNNSRLEQKYLHLFSALFPLHRIPRARLLCTVIAMLPQRYCLTHLSRGEGLMLCSNHCLITRRLSSHLCLLFTEKQVKRRAGYFSQRISETLLMLSVKNAPD